LTVGVGSLRAEDLVVVPRPKQLEVLGLGPPVAECPRSVVPDQTIAAEGFRLDITASDGARIACADDAGRRYGEALLDQLLGAPVDGRVVAVHVEDHPDLAVRGFMLDISRDRVPTRDTLGRLVALLELARYNQLQLYVEHTFAHVGHDDVWADASPMTVADLRWLDDRCVDAGIELVANRNCFGHFEHWLRLPRYAPRAEALEGIEVFAGLRLPAAVLAPTPDNAEFALGLVREQLACVRSRRVNIGCDETFELGRGTSAAQCAERGAAAVYLDHVRRLADPLVADGFQVQIWADVVRRHPDLAATLPPQVVPIAWTYEAPCDPSDLPEVPPSIAAALHDVGVDLDTSGGFDTNVAPLAEAGVAFWVAPGTGDWNSLIGRIDNAFANQIDAADTARNHDASGFLVTAWGDNGHHHPPAITDAPLIHGGAVAWGVDANRDLDVAKVLDRHVYLDATGRVGQVIDSLGRLWRQTGRRSFNASPLAGALFGHLPLVVTGRPDPGRVADVLGQLDDLDRQLAQATPTAVDGAQVVAELHAATDLARQGAWRLLRDGGPSVADRADHLAGAIDAQRAAWLGRARPGGLNDSLAHLERTLTGDRALIDG